MTSEDCQSRSFFISTGIRAQLNRILVLVFVSYGLLYFSYKFETPWSGASDFTQYYRIYLSPLNVRAAPAPFVCRQLSAVLTYLVAKAHIYYPNQIAFQDPRFSQRVYFAAMFTNWLFLVLAAWLAGLIAEQELQKRNPLVALMAGFFCLLSFETQPAVLTGLTEGPNWFLFAAGFLACQRRSISGLTFVLVLSSFQRETILVALGTIAFLELLLKKEAVRFHLQAVATACCCFAGYLLVRKMALQGNADQLQLRGMISALGRIHNLRSLVLQGFLSQNTLGLFLLLPLLRSWRTEREKLWVPILLATAVVIDLLGLAAGIGNNVGRIGSVLTPALAGFVACSFAASGQPRVPVALTPPPV